MSISIIIPVFREGALINEAISRLESAASTEEPVEIIVVDGSEEGETVKAVSSNSAKGMISGKGRGIQMNAGASAAQGDIVVFLHADTELPPDGLEKISSMMQNGDFVGGAFDLGIADGSLSFRIIERVASLRSRLTQVPYGDQAIFFKRDYFLRIGGYGNLPIMEDVDLMRRVKKEGGRICILHEKVKTSARRWKTEGIVACTLRNWTIMLLYLLGVAPERLARWYP
ncbi:MAG: putative glycosyl transferase [Syntrophorhabdaceae bacterium PtaU1.Bin034]|nr:MAG: putative glycosyl transferase [Syntrophorhabdaceae bacterium PtaU1.Bin034]